MSRNGRDAGKRTERKVAADLRAMLGDGWTVVRLPTDRQAGQAGTAGEFKIHRDDETADGPEAFPFCVECKDGYGFEAGHLWKDPITGPITSTSKRRGFWQQAREQADVVGLAPLLVVKGAGRSELLCILRSREAAVLPIPGPRMSLTLEGQALVAVRWASFASMPASVLCEVAA